MDWKLTKTYMILFLTILNIILLFTNLSINKDYKINNIQKKSIISFANKNNIKISSEIPKTFYPMNSVSMKKYQHNELNLQKIFFGDLENIKKTTNLGTTIFKKDKKTLIINNSSIIFEDTKTPNNFIFNEKYALQESNLIKNNLSKQYGKMIIDIVRKENNFYQVSYIQKINKYKNFSNYLNVKIFEDGKKIIAFNFYNKIGPLNQTKVICAPDEAIYTFSKEITNLFDEEIEITQIDLGYYLGNIKNDYEYVFKPYYRFYIKNSPNPFFVNAFTNTFEFDINIAPLSY